MKCRVLIPISPDDAETSPPSSPCQVHSGRHICKNTKYRLAPNVLIHTNYQEIKIQENAKALAVGNVPRSICVLLQDDLADMCQTGGVCVRRWMFCPQKGHGKMRVHDVTQHLRPQTTICGVQMILR